MTEFMARFLAKFDRNYSARQIRGQWLVWDGASDHAVEFSAEDVELARRLEAVTF